MYLYKYTKECLGMVVSIDFQLIPSNGGTSGEFLVNLAPTLLWTQSQPSRRELEFSILELSSEGVPLVSSCPCVQVVFSQLRYMIAWRKAYFFVSRVRLIHPDESSASPHMALCLVDSETGRSRVWLATN